MRPFGLPRRIGLALLTGYIFVYFSEYAFWARPLDGARLPGVITLLLLYSFCAYAFLIIIAHFRVRSVPAVFLAAALYGWLVEGAFVQTMYANLPLSISFTGLAWHAIITILGGWLGLQTLLRRRRWPLTTLVSALSGLVYGAWAIWWWIDQPPAIPLTTFAAYVFITTAILACAYWLASRPTLLRFTPSRAEIIITALLILLYFALVTVPTVWFAALILPPLTLLVLLALRKNRRIERRPDALETLAAAGPLRLRDVLPLLALPLTATAVYGLATAAHALIPTGWAFYLLLTTWGFLLLAASLVAIWRAKAAEQPAVASPASPIHAHSSR